MGFFAIDIRTVLLLLVVSNLGALLILLAYRRPRAAERPLRLFMVGTGAHALSWALLAQRNLWPDFWSVYVGNVLVLGGFGLECLAIASADGDSRRLDRVFYGLSIAGILGFCAFAGSPNGRACAASIVMVALFAALAYVLFFTGRGSALRLVIGASAALYCAAHAARAAYAIAAGPSFGLLTPAMVQSLAFLPLFVFLTAGTIGFILILKEKSDLALRESEEKYRSLVERASEAIIIVQDERFAFVNRRMAELLGLPAQELVGRMADDYVWPEDRERVRASRSARLAGRAVPEAYDIRIGLGMGAPTWVSLSAARIQWQGRPATLALLTDITERKRSEDEIVRLLGEKELLLKEVHHRIKNNLNVAMSLLSLQAESSEGKDPAAALLDASNRLQALVKLYDLLHASGRFQEMPASEFLEPLVRGILASFPRGEDVALALELGAFSLDAGRLTTIGLFVNEIVTNSMKYAFAGVERPTIVLSASLAEGRVRLVCGDRGRGLPPAFDPAASRGLGMQLISMLAVQLGARLELERDGGLRYAIEFPLEQ